MSLNRWLQIIIFIGIICVAAVFGARQSRTATTTTTTSEQINQVDEAADHHNGNSDILDLIVNPIKSTLSRARRLLSSQIDTLGDRANLLRFKTFSTYMRIYNKTYPPEEIPRRMALFFKRREQISNSIKSYRAGRAPFALRINKYADLDDAELKQLTGVSPPANLETEDLDFSDEDEASMSVRKDREEEEQIPASKDWRTSGCISEPIDQKECGACYAIATMAAVESMRCLKHVPSPVLSPQQVVDCSTTKKGYDNHGCNGGWPTQVLKYLQDVEVVARETCYPFKRRRSACRLDEVKETSGCTVRASATDQRRLRYKVLRNEQDMLYHVAKTGPVIAVMRAPDSFFYYGQGIFDDPDCTKKRSDIDHAILIVGYGTKDGEDYWLLKNSWGTSEWGKAGYGLYKRGSRACSIGHYAWAIIA